MKHPALTWCLTTLWMAAVFVSAFLLIWVQPLISKQLTPILGGSPMVWNSLLFLFQFLLLLGYLYAHLNRTYAKGLWGLLLHSALLIIAIWFLPLEVISKDANPPLDSPYGWVLWQSIVIVGAPFFVLAASAPLLQGWYDDVMRAQRPDSRSSYGLYGVSNLGSFAALISFPFLLEPLYGTIKQLALWSDIYYGFVAAALLMALICFGVLRQLKQNASPVADRPSQCPSWRQIGLWVLLAFLGSSLMHGVTTFITTDIGGIPLAWMIPLGLYMLTFSISFSGSLLYRHVWVLRAVPLVVALTMVYGFWTDPTQSYLLIGLHLLLFFVLTLACHGELYQRRPDKYQMTAFYLSLSAGGVLGGFLHVIVAPLLFDMALEYPLTIALLLYLLVRLQHAASGLSLYIVLRELVLAAIFSVVIFELYLFWFTHRADALQYAYFAPLLLAVMAGVCASHRHALRLALCLLALFFVTAETSLKSLYGFNLFPSATYRGSTLMDSHRNFFGILRVFEARRGDDRTYELYHGTSWQQAQVIGEIRLIRSNYQHLIMHQAHQWGDPVAVLGLGTARYQCAAMPDQHIRYFELNPGVKMFAKDTRYFTQLKDCPGSNDLVMGDARLMMSQEPDGTYGAIISSIYFSSSVPHHLYSREAIDMFLKKLKARGYLVLLVPNRYFEFRPLFEAYADYFDVDVYESDVDEYKVMVMVKGDAPAAMLFRDAHFTWQKLTPQSGDMIWTDDYHNIVSVWKW